MTRRTLWLVGGVAILASCTDAPTTPRADAALLATNANASLWAEVVAGKTGPGSLYELYKPVNWNGKAVFYGHGFNDVAAPVMVPSSQDSAAAVRDALGALGYAVAMTSYSNNGWNFDDGTRRLHQLKGILRSKFGNPTRSYLAGHSLGAIISLGMAEQYGAQYDGALLMCGVLGGARSHFNWVGDVRVLFDWFYPGVLPGDVTYIPPGTDVTNDIITPATAAIMANPTPAFYITYITQTPIAGTNPAQIIRSLVYALAWHSRGINDVTARAHGHLPYDNHDRVYTSPVLPPAVMAAINATVPRYTSPPDVQAWLDHNYEPTGAVKFPVLTLHTTQDESVPFWHENLFAAKVAAAGTSALVVQRPIARYGHCSFTVNDMITAFTDLTNWVENGVKPTP